ncbi:MAG: anti-CBASS protein Acb1 family protein [Waterburya sp.]
MAREWGGLKLGKGSQLKIEEVNKSLSPLRKKYKYAQQCANLYGGAAILRIVDDGLDPIKPLDSTKLLPVEHSRILDRWEIQATPEAILKDWLDPEYYQITTHDLTVKVHKSRVIRFDGAFAGKEAATLNQGWGDSVLVSFFAPMLRYFNSLGYVSEAVRDFEIFIHYIEGLFDRLAGDSRAERIEAEEKVAERLRLNQQQRSSMRGMVADMSHEKMEFVGRKFSGVAEILDRVKDEMVAASGLTRPQFLQEHPSGLAATGESERRAEADSIRALQEDKWGENIRFDCELLLGTTVGWEWEWKNLYQSTPSEESEIRKDLAQTDKLYIELGVITPEEVRNSRFAGADYSIETTLLRNDAKSIPKYGDRVSWLENGAVITGKVIEVISRAIVTVDGELNGSIDNPVLLIDVEGNRSTKLLAQLL